MNNTASGAMPSYLSQLDPAALKAELADVQFSTCLSAEGRRTALYRLGCNNGPKVVLLPPYGVTFLLVARLARALSKNFQVLIWESKGCPNADIPMVDADLELTAQSSDFRDIVEQEAFEDFHFVGWCQAAQLVAHAFSYARIKPKTMSFIAPAGFGYSLVKSEFDRCALPIYLEIARQGVSGAEKLARILDKYRDVPPSKVLEGDRLTMLHLSDPHATYVFSKYMRSYEHNKTTVNRLLSDVLSAVPAQTIHCKDDTYSHFSESVQLSKKHPSVQLRLLPQGGHLQVFNEPETQADIVSSFIRSSSLDTTTSVTRV
ncbi:alpha/beta fold hydrolase [Sorangium sp. So ce131]|uniref:alpha/beta fold hydrolase n=1 Tax=Sorangium sp. So ce131 TaxID=3133282 RepID=UPI003F631C22